MKLKQFFGWDFIGSNLWNLMVTFKEFWGSPSENLYLSLIILIAQSFSFWFWIFRKQCNFLAQNIYLSMRASRDARLGYLDIFGSAVILWTIFLTRLHMHKSFVHFLKDCFSNYQIKTQKHCGYVSVGVFLTVTSEFSS